MPSPQQAFVSELQGLLQISLFDRNAGQVEIRRSRRFGAPGGFEESVAGFGQLVQQLQGQAQIEIRFPGVGVGVAPGLFFDRRPEIRNALFDLPVAQQIQTVGVVQPNIRGVPAQALQVVIRGQEGGVAVLLQVLARQVQFFQGLDFTGLLQRFGGLRNGLVFLYIFFVFAKHVSAFIIHRHPVIPQSFHRIHEGFHGAQIGGLSVDFLSLRPQHNAGVFIGSCGVDLNTGLSALPTGIKSVGYDHRAAFIQKVDA